MHRAVIRAVNARKIYANQQAYRQNLRYLRIFYYYVKKNKKALFALNCFSSKLNLKGRSMIKDTCIVTGRSRGLTSVNINRMQIRPLTESGAIKGLKKFYN